MQQVKFSHTFKSEANGSKIIVKYSNNILTKRIRKMSCIMKLFLTIFIVNTLQLTATNADTPVSPLTPRKCFSCTGANCFRTSMTEVSTTCTDVLDICVTIFDEFAVVAKGCYQDIAEDLRQKCDQRNNPECFKCFGQLCNNLGRADFKCIECNSKDNSKCNTDTTDIKAAQCSIPTAPNSYCYVKQNGKNEIQRGCLTHVKEQLDCLKSDGCSMCLSQDGEACNAYRLGTTSASGAMQSVVFSFSAILAMIVIHLLK